MSNKLTWVVNGRSHGGGQTSAQLVCGGCKKLFNVQASTAAGVFARLQMAWSMHVFEEHTWRTDNEPVACENPEMGCWSDADVE